MSVTVTPTDGMSIERAEGTTFDEPFYKEYTVSNGLDVPIHLIWPDFSNYEGVFIETNDQTVGPLERSPTINVDQQYKFRVRVSNQYVNQLPEGIFKQILKIGIVEEDGPVVPPPTPDYYRVVADPNPVEVLAGVEMAAVTIQMIGVYSDGREEVIWPEGGFRIDPQEGVIREGWPTNAEQLDVFADSRSGNSWFVKLIVTDPYELDAWWNAQPRDAQYTNFAGNKANAEVHFVLKSRDDSDGNVGDGGDPTDPSDPTDGTGGPDDDDGSVGTGEGKVEIQR